MEKIYRKTYGARGLLEWKMVLYVGKAKVKFTFAGGKMGDNGVLPAKFATDNPALQALIEGSSYFSSGKVYVCREPEEISGQP